METSEHEIARSLDSLLAIQNATYCRGVCVAELGYSSPASRYGRYLVSFDQYFRSPTQSLLSNNLRMLVWVRGVAWLGQVGALVYASVMLPMFSFNPLILLMLLAQLVLIGVSLWQSQVQRVVSMRGYIANLLSEFCAFSLMMYVTGGATNPFVFYYLVPLAVSVLVLPRHFAWGMTGVAISLYTLLMFVYQPLQLFEMQGAGHGGSHFSSPHLMGMWLNFAVSAGLITGFVSRMAHAIRQREHQLAQRDQRQREQDYVFSMAAITAGTAHELGTPLSTIAIVLDDIQASGQVVGEVGDELNVALAQVERSKAILQRLVKLSQTAVDSEDRSLRLEALVMEIVDQARLLFPAVHFDCEVSADAKHSVVTTNLPLSQGLQNILANAAEASVKSSRATVAVRAEVFDNQWRLQIQDSGSGVSADLLEKLGEQPVSNKKSGLGLGYFLAHAAINRVGGTLQICNRDEGAEVTLCLPIELGSEVDA